MAVVHVVVFRVHRHRQRHHAVASAGVTVCYGVFDKGTFGIDTVVERERVADESHVGAVGRGSPRAGDLLGGALPADAGVGGRPGLRLLATGGGNISGG